MKPQILGLRIAGTLFAVVAVAHVWRVIVDASLVIGAWEVPTLLSAFAALVSAALGVWMWNLAARMPVDDVDEHTVWSE